jgi:transketolase
MSDGDCNEGSTWEAIMFAAQHGLDNLVGIVDYNRVQALGAMHDVIEMEPFSEKLEIFGWAVKTMDGHNFDEMEKCFSSVPFVPGKPSWILARTTKCKGISHLENTVGSHYGCIKNDADFQAAMAELKGAK